LPGVSAAGLLAGVRAHAESVLLPAMRAISPDCAIIFEEIVDAPGLDERGNRSLAEALMPLCGCHAPRRVSFGTEAGFLVARGLRTLPGGARAAPRRRPARLNARGAPGPGAPGRDPSL